MSSMSSDVEHIVAFSVELEQKVPSSSAGELISELRGRTRVEGGSEVGVGTGAELGSGVGKSRKMPV